jgi:hypothetical protein
MPDEGATVETLDDPTEWPAVLRSLLGRADGSTDRETLADELGADAGERRLAFLKRLGILAGDDDPRPGPGGREYLDTDDEAVLHGALAAASDGFDATMEALAVRPPTDVEMVDLLSATLDSAVDSATVDRYRVWLRALGYLTRDDGVNELTRKGRQLAVTTDRLAPGGADRDAAPESGTEPTVGSPPDAGPTPPAADHGAGSDADRETLERDLRARYDDVCMLCGDRRQRGPEAGHAVVHYLMPSAPPHDGPVTPANALVVCPNHRADLEHGTATVDPRSLTVEHSYEQSVDGRRLLTADDHEVGAQYLAYHSEVVAGE